MPNIKSSIPKFLKNFDYTNKLIPNRETDTRIEIIVKCAIITLTLGLAFIGTLIIDSSIKLFHKFSNRSKPSIAIDDRSENIPASRQSSSPPVETIADTITNYLKEFFTQENILKISKSVWEGFCLIPKKATDYLLKENNDKYTNIGYGIGLTTPFWIAGGFVKGSIISFLLVSSGLALKTLHQKWTTPPANHPI